MKKFCLALVIVAGVSAVAVAQSIEQLYGLSSQQTASVADFSVMKESIFELFPGQPDGEALLEKLLGRYEPEQPLTKGRASLLLARVINLRTSLFFILMPSERSAFRAFVADGLFSGTSSSGDRMSGIDLIDMIARAGILYGEAE